MSSNNTIFPTGYLMKISLNNPETTIFKGD